MTYYINKWINVMGIMKIVHIVDEDCKESIVLAEFDGYACRGAGYIDESRIRIIGELNTYSKDHWMQYVGQANRAKPTGITMVYNYARNGGVACQTDNDKYLR